MKTRYEVAWSTICKDQYEEDTRASSLQFLQQLRDMWQQIWKLNI